MVRHSPWQHYIWAIMCPSKSSNIGAIHTSFDFDKIGRVMGSQGLTECLCLALSLLTSACMCRRVTVVVCVCVTTLAATAFVDPKKRHHRLRFCFV